MSDSAFREAQRKAGAVDFDLQAPAPQARHFGDPQSEYNAAQSRSAVFDLSDRTQIQLTGEDRAKFLNNFCTNDVYQLQPGQGCEAYITNVKGRVLGHMFVFVANDAIWLESVPGAEEALLPHLDRYLIAEDVELHGRTAELAELLVTGPEAAVQLRKLNISADSLAPYEHLAAEFAGGPISVRRVDLLGRPDFLLIVARERLVELWNRLLEENTVPAGAAAFHALRIEAGMPLYGQDISDENLAQEVARTTQAISFTKGCYLGQEPIARIDALGHVNRELRGLTIDSADPPERGSSVWTPDGEKEIGKVTSSARQLAADKQQSLALAYLRRGHLDPGSDVLVSAGDQKVAAKVFWPHVS